MKPFIMLLMLSFFLFAQNEDVITIDQTGVGNSANAQILNFDGYHYVTIIQVGNYNGTEYDLTGDGIADPTMIIQESPESKATIEEYGNRNSALIHQVGTSPAVAGIYQDGDQNVALLRQGEKNGGYAGRAELIQQGNCNRVEVDQPPEYNNLITSQSGNRNTMIIYQNYASGITPVQNGNGNVAFIETGISAALTLSQYGNNNFSDQYQELRFSTYTPRSTGSVYQDGHDNTAHQFQQDFTDFDDPGTAEIIQCGINNYASQIQIGPGLSSRITQTGNNNRAESYQNGLVF
jgi:hypothetical protein